VERKVLAISFGDDDHDDDGRDDRHDHDVIRRYLL